MSEAIKVLNIKIESKSESYEIKIEHKPIGYTIDECSVTIYAPTDPPSPMYQEVFFETLKRESESWQFIRAVPRRIKELESQISNIINKLTNY